MGMFFGVEMGEVLLLFLRGAFFSFFSRAQHLIAFSLVSEIIGSFTNDADDDIS